MQATAKRNALLLNLAILLFLPAALANLALSFHQGMQPARGQDFQWSGTRMVLHHIDPWKDELAGDPIHAVELNQVPNYLHETYLLLAPYGLLGLPRARLLWAITNCLMALAGLFILGGFFGLGRKRTVLLALVFFTGYPFRESLGNGQQNFFELLAFCCAFCLTPTAVRGIALGLSYVKYNFSPVFFFYLLFRRNWKVIALSFVPPLFGLFGVWALVHTSISALAVEPFMVSRNGIVVTAADLMALTRWLAGKVLPSNRVELLSYAVGAGASILYGLHLARARWLSERAVVACLATATLLLMRHGFYDFIFLIVPLANLPHLVRTSSKAMTALIFGYFWYGARLSTMASVNVRMVIDLLLLGALLYLAESNERRKNSYAAVPREMVASTS